MRTIDITRRSARSLMSAKIRTILTAFAIAVGAFALTLTLAASNGANLYAQTIVRNNFNPTQLIVTHDMQLFNVTNATSPQEYNPNFGNVVYGNGVTRQVQLITDADIARIIKVPGVDGVQPVSSLGLQYVTRDGQREYEASVAPFDSYSEPTILAGNIQSNLSNGTVILPLGFVAPLGFSNPQDAIGKTIRLSVKKQQNQSSVLALLFATKNTDSSLQSSSSIGIMEKKFKVIAVIKPPSTVITAATALYLYINPSDILQLSDYTTEGTTDYHKYVSVKVGVTDGTDISKLHAAQHKIENLGYTTMSVMDTEKTITQVISVLQGIVSIFGVIAVIASIFGIINTMYISVIQRTREIGLMKALGMHKNDIYKLFLCEAGLIGILGGCIGVIIAVILGTLLNPEISSYLGMGDVYLLDFNVVQLFLLIVILGLVAIITGVLPARKAATIDPIIALRTE